MDEDIAENAILMASHGKTSLNNEGTNLNECE